MLNIVLARVDSRLIHGQVVTKWLQQSNANKIVVVSDEFLQSIYLMAAPPNVEVVVKGNESIKDYANKTHDSSDKVLFLVPDLETLNNVVNQGIVHTEVQIGGLGGGPERKNVMKNINLSERDVEILENLLAKDINVFFQAIPEESPVPIARLIEKYKKL